MGQKSCNHNDLVTRLNRMAEIGSSGVLWKGHLVEAKEVERIGRLMAAVMQQTVNGKRHLHFPDWGCLPPLP